MDATAAQNLELAGTLSVASLELEATGGDITQSGGTLTVSAGPTDLKAGDDITLDKANDFNGVVNVLGGDQVKINDVSNLKLGNVTITGKLDATASTDLILNGTLIVASLALEATVGDITQSAGTLTVTAGPTTLKAGDDITLDKANDFNGLVNVLGGDAVTINDINNLTLGNITTTSLLDAIAAQNLDLTGTLSVASLELEATVGDITQSGGTLTVSTGPTDLKAGDDITLGRANDFNGLVNVLSADAVTINDINSLTLGNVTTTGLLDATAAQNLDLAGTLSVASLELEATGGDITQTASMLTVTAGPTTLKAGVDITLDKANDFNGAVNVLGADQVKINDVSNLKLGNVAITGNLSVGSNGALDLGASSMGGNLLANSGSGNISQSGPLTVNGSSVLNASRGAIELLNPVNRLVGGVTVTASRSNIVGDLMGQALAAQAAAKAQAILPVGQSPGSMLPGAASPQPLVMASGPAAGSSSSSGGALGAGGGANSSGVVIDLLSGQAAGTNTMVAVSLPKGMATAGTGFGFELPESVRMMAEQAPQGIRAQASLPDGASLPSWLKFDPERQRFDASAVPDGAFPMQVVVSVGLQRVLVVVSERNE
jgi:hypothetical protein